MDTQVDTAAIAPRPADAGIPFLTQLMPGTWASVNAADKVQVTRALNATQADAMNLSDMIGTQIRIVHVVVHPAESNLDTAAPGETYRRVLFRLDDGKLVACGAKGVFHSLFLLAARWGPPPWRGGVPVVCRQKTVGKSGRWLYLELIEPETDPVQNELPF